MIVSPTNDRGNYRFKYNLTHYASIKIDTEVINKELASNGCFIRLMIAKNNSDSEDSIKEVAVTTYEETKKQRDVYYIDVEKLEGIYDIGYQKNMTLGNTSAEMNIYNLWLEE